MEFCGIRAFQSGTLRPLALPMVLQPGTNGVKALPCTHFQEPQNQSGIGIPFLSIALACVWKLTDARL
jgi:hypothetical protein